MAVNDEIFKNLAQYGGGTINERVYNFLGSLGYTGTINDRLSKFEEGGRKGWQGLIRAWGQYTPAQVFSQGQEGVWYEPKPIVAGQQVLYQDSAGTTPVTADGDPVGLMLDLSRGLVLGPELVTNGTFDDNIDGWADFNNTQPSEWVSGTIRVYHGSTATGAYATFPTEAGKTYRLTGAIVEASVISAQARLRVGDGTTPDAGIAEAIITDTGTYSVTFTAVSATSYVYLRNGDSAVARWDNISVRELPGNHATQATSAARPIYRTDGLLHWLETDGVDDRLELTYSVTFSSASFASSLPSSTSAVLGNSNESGNYIAVSQEEARWRADLVDAHIFPSSVSAPNAISFVRDDSGNVRCWAGDLVSDTEKTDAAITSNSMFNRNQGYYSMSFYGLVVSSSAWEEAYRLSAHNYSAKLAGVTL